MNYYEIFSPTTPDDHRTAIERLSGRDETVKSVSSATRDVIVIGGGIHGAAVAWLGSLSGLKVALFEKGEYACETSSRSSKMAHGGLRYLQYFDLQQVREGVREREKLFRIASHIVKPIDFFIPVHSSRSWERIKLKIGLTLYDLFSGTKRRHRWVENPDFCIPQWSQGGYVYSDGILDDKRLVQEMIVASRQEGALCVTHAEVLVVNHQRDNTVSVTWKDLKTGERHETKAGAVINCAGPWVATAGRASRAEFGREIKFSRGSHLLFCTPWNGPALTIPLPEKGRFYFVWPHKKGTLVGTTEREIDAPLSDPKPSQDEIDELFRHLSRDLPHSGLTKDTLIDTFAGIRTLPLRGGGHTAKLSRKHKWIWSGGMLNLVGGKLTTALWTAKEGLSMLNSIAGNQFNLSVSERLLPGLSQEISEEVLLHK